MSNGKLEVFDIRNMTKTHSISIESKMEFPVHPKRKKGVVLNAVDFHVNPNIVSIASDDAVVRLYVL